ncbi:homoserine kinase [Cephaloticoccus capnophilus]|nr:homoserine kinase [Cephaloticoccus capnophilus]
MNQNPTAATPALVRPPSVASVTVTVPGSTSNFGAGFDTLGMAVSVANRVTVSRLETSEASEGGGIFAERESDARAQKMVAKVAARFFEECGRERFSFSYRIEGEVPRSRGLGSSVTVRAGIVAALNQLSGAGLSRDQLVRLVSELEGHPDNAAAGILGGFCVARSDPQTGHYVDTIRAAVPESLVFVTAAPLFEVSTQASRGVLPQTLPYFDAVRSINSAGYLIAAMLTGDYERLRGAVSDFMHEPYRLPGIPGAVETIAAGVRAGALTGWLSGSGSSVMCAAYREDGPRVLAAMRESFERLGQSCEAVILNADNEGLRINAGA